MSTIIVRRMQFLRKQYIDAICDVSVNGILVPGMRVVHDRDSFSVKWPPEQVRGLWVEKVSPETEELRSEVSRGVLEEHWLRRAKNG